MALIGALAVGWGGAMGAVIRYAVGVVVERRALDTLLVNVVGSFALGVVLVAGLGETATLAVGVGFCGAFTTFSSFAVESIRLAEDGEVLVATTYAIGTLLLAVLGVVLGVALGGILA